MNYPKIICADYAYSLVEVIIQCRDYADFVSRCRPLWNTIKRRHGLKPIKFDAFEYTEFRNKLLENEYDSKKEFIEVFLNNSISDVCAITLLNDNIEMGCINVAIFLNETFTGRMLNDTIAVCTENSTTEELKAILVHELTHCIQSEVDKAPRIQNNRYFLIRDGIASVVAALVCRCPEWVALNMARENWLNCHAHSSYIKKLFLETLGHDSDDSTDLKNPFDHHKDLPFSRYGYYLGYRFILNCLERGHSIAELIANYHLADEAIDGFLKE